MDDPVRDIEGVVLQLTEGSPQAQENAINKYFLSNASFTHPFCRTGSFEGSRLLIHGIFRWYKIMSPVINLKVNGVAYDEHNLTLYISISQTFAIWFIPFHRSPVSLTTKLQLQRKPFDKKYYIASQNDLYQVDQFVKFFAPWGIGDYFVFLWHFWATFFCVVLSVLFNPFTRLEQRWANGRPSGVEKMVMDGVEAIEERRMKMGHSNGVDGRIAAEEMHEVADRLKKGVEENGHGNQGEKGEGQFGSMQVVKP